MPTSSSLNPPLPASRFTRRSTAVRIGIVLLLTSAAVHAQTDLVETLNGDRLTGEIKRLDRGMLSFDTDATDTIQIEWSYVRSLTSNQNFLVTLDDGRQLFGSWETPVTVNELQLQTAVGPIGLPLPSIVRMTPIEGRLIERISMSVDVGYNIAKANNLAQTDFSYDFSYRSEERLVSTSLDASRSSTGNEPASIRGNTGISYRRFVGDRVWDPIGFGSIERIDELGLDRRVTVGGGMSRWLTDTNSNRISFTGGIVATRENETEAIESQESVEALAAVQLDWFRYEAPEFDVALELEVYQRLSDSNRTRGNLDVDLRWELINDFFWGFSLYYSFNSEPTGVDTSSEDYGVVTSLGWSF